MLDTITLTENKLTFTIGKLDECARYVARKLTRNTNGFIVLPCSLNDLAHLAKNTIILRAYKQIDVLLPDGMPIIWAIRRRGKKTDRIYGPNLMKYLISLPKVQRAKHIFYGSSPATLKKLITFIKQQHPNLTSFQTISPPYRELTVAEEKNYINKIKRYKPDYLWLGLNSPKQVQLATKWKRVFPNTTILCVGAAFDLLAGMVPQAPRFVQRMGLEWAFRLLMEPRRLWRRYLIDIPGYLLRRPFFRF